MLIQIPHHSAYQDQHPEEAIPKTNRGIYYYPKTHHFEIPKSNQSIIKQFFKKFWYQMAFVGMLFTCH